MPSEMEFDGKDVDLAVKKASKKLCIPSEKLKYNVISYGSTGIFGLVGAKKARIRVTVPDSTPQKPPKLNVAPLPEPDAKAAPDEEPVAGPPEAPSDPEPDPEMTPEKTSRTMDQAAVKAGSDALQQMVDAITTGASITVQAESEQILYNISSDDSAILIGKHGQTLDAIQYLVEKIVNRQNSDRFRVQVDIEGYLKNRKDSLKQLAERLAEKVKRTGKPASAGQMNAQDRKIVHMALKEDAAVRTQSMGTGLYRNLMIFPKKNSKKKKST